MNDYGQHTIFKKVSVILAVLTVLLFAITIYMGWENTSFYRSGQKTIGKIVGFETAYAGNRRPVLFPVVQFKDHRGELHQITSNISTRYTRIYQVGEPYKVVYGGRSPSSISMRANSIFGLWGKFIVMGAMTFFNLILYFIFDYYSHITLSKPHDKKQ
jgi:hypothetical protein